jgi:hypothetical protein
VRADDAHEGTTVTPGTTRRRRAGTSAREEAPAAEPRRRLGHESPGSVLRGPPITLTCPCGTREKVAYGASWTCSECGRTWDTSAIPRDEYLAIRRITWRYRLLPIALGLLVATVAAFFVLTGNGTSVFVLLPLSLMVWFTFLRGAHRRRYLAALADRRRWTVGDG